MKKTIRRFFQYFGYDIIKVPRSSFLKKDKIVKVGKFYLTIPKNNPLQYTYIEQKDFSSEVLRLAEHVHEKYPDLIFLDVGANIGDTAAMVKSAKDIPIISIEGDEFSFSYLQKNVQQFNKIQTFNYYLGDKEESMNVDLQKKGWNTTIIPDNKSETKIEIITLDTFLSTHFTTVEINKIKLFKIDTEGFDTIIIRGAQNFIKQTKPVIYFEYNRDNMSAIKEDGLTSIFALKEIGYDKIIFYDDKGKFILGTDITNKEIISDLHNYANGKNSLIYYYNICMFHANDNDLAQKVISTEKMIT
jgi:FkbM family methyltransferase